MTVVGQKLLQLFFKGVFPLDGFLCFIMNISTLEVSVVLRNFYQKVYFLRMAYSKMHENLCTRVTNLYVCIVSIYHQIRLDYYFQCKSWSF
eukprot:TRINITY_DN99030_c0_g1_i1.p1 TRINITY_DN99030_c0_g1~~TRINITY_DN99030_c0_g1_i1.p1  ORF type:complete len:105 (-),score=0.54 TRINITY_DN99030_c0_g1_i1:59-331(-)